MCRLSITYQRHIIRKRYNDADKLYTNSDDTYTVTYLKPGTHQFNKYTGPAWIQLDKYLRIVREKWYKNESLHRLDGPADIWYTDNGKVGYTAWYINGINLNRTEIEDWLELNRILYPLSKEDQILFKLRVP